jgi:hypothetical protein
LEQQQESQARLRQQRLQAEAVRTDVAAFCNRIRSRLADAALTEKQAILHLVIERIIVGEGRLEIRHVIPLRSPPPGSNGPAPPKNTRLRMDGVHGATLMPGRGPDLLERLPEAERPVAGGQFRGNSRQLCVLSRRPTWKPTSSFLPSGVAPISTSMHSACGSIRAWR